MVTAAAGGVGRPAARPVAAKPAKVARARRHPLREPMSDTFYNFVVLASVVLFMILATGVGVLAIQSSLR